MATVQSFSRSTARAGSRLRKRGSTCVIRRQTKRNGSDKVAYEVQSLACRREEAKSSPSRERKCDLEYARSYSAEDVEQPKATITSAYEKSSTTSALMACAIALTLSVRSPKFLYYHFTPTINNVETMAIESILT